MASSTLIRRVQKICCQKKYLKAIVMTSISRDSNNNLEQQKKKKGFLQSISNSHYIFLFLSYSFGIEAIKKFFHTRSSLENYTRFRDQTEQSLYPFSDQKGPKTLPFGAAHTYMAYIREYPLPPPWATTCFVNLHSSSLQVLQFQLEFTK